METLKELLAVLGFEPENIQAVLYISLASVFGTHFLKKRVSFVSGESISILLGAFSGAFLWAAHVQGALVGAILGSFWTVAYKPLMRMAYKKWPDLEDKLSAAPQKKAVQTPTGVEVRDITVPSAPDEKTLFIGSPTEPPGSE